MLAKLKEGADSFTRLKTEAVLVPKNLGLFLGSVWNSDSRGVVLKTTYEWESRQHHHTLPCSAVLPVSQQLCAACYRLIKHGLFSEKVALSPKSKLAMREGLQLNDCALMLGSFWGSFYQVLKICVPQSKDCSRLSLLQCSSGYDNCRLRPWLDMARSNFSAPGILL